MRLFAGLLMLLVLVAPARADSDTLLPATFASLQGDLKKALSKASVREPLAALPCLEGSTEKRKVCPYKLGEYMQIMAETEKGGKDIVGLTMICGTTDARDSLKCLLAYAAAMSLLAPDIDQDKRGKIMGTLVEGLSVGMETSIRTEERKFILQKSMGLWFHIEAADADN
jgi:hypothetical protein